LHQARVLARTEAGGGLVLLSIRPEESARRTYVRAGQYVSVHVASVSSYFALAWEAGAATWELILRPGGDAADAILAMPEDGEITTSGALGPGFPLDEARRRPLLLAATGSGVAAMRPVVMHRLRDEDGSRTELLLGVRTMAEVPLPVEIAAWRASGVRVTICLSRDDGRGQDEGDRAGYARGYVQDVARGLAAHRGGMVFAAGVKPMIEGIRALAQDLGIAEADVRTNY
jgi:sulfhydrogenase subunit gamma (sulfur reductase)